MMDPDQELALLEQEFGKSADALVAAPGSAADERILSVARRHALYLAGRVGDSVDEVPVPPGGRLEPGGPVSGVFDAGWGSQAVELSADFDSLLQPAPGEDMEQELPGDPNLARPMPPREDVSIDMDAVSAAEPPSLNEASDEADKELQRLRGRDRDAWRQRMAELVLQGKVRTARYLIVRYEREFDQDE